MGLGDYGLGDYGLGDYGLGDYGLGTPGEIDLETALVVGGRCTEFPHCGGVVAWKTSSRRQAAMGGSARSTEVATYEVFRVLGLPSDIGQAARIGIVTAPLTEFLDASSKPARRTYTYFVIAVSVDGARSPRSNLAVIQVP